MFTLSLGKILFTILVIVAVWKGFAMLTRLQHEHKQRVGGGRSRATRRSDGRTVDLVECPHCGAYYDPSTACRCGHPAVRRT